jgi:hypothetical protein
MKIDSNDVQQENVHAGSSDNVDFDSNLISESEEEYVKQKSPRNPTFARINSDFNDVQWENADTPMPDNLDPDSNLISESEEQFADRIVEIFS